MNIILQICEWRGREEEKVKVIRIQSGGRMTDWE